MRNDASFAPDTLEVCPSQTSHHPDALQSKRCSWRDIQTVFRVSCKLRSTMTLPRQCECTAAVASPALTVTFLRGNIIYYTYHMIRYRDTLCSTWRDGSG